MLRFVFISFSPVCVRCFMFPPLPLLPYAQLVLGLSRGCHDVLGDGVLERYLPVTLFSPERHAQWTYSATRFAFLMTWPARPPCFACPGL